MILKNASREEAYKLDPKKLPKRIELELPEEVFGAMQKAAESTGCSISEIAIDILSKGIEK
jgi:hypothetical protein